MPQEIINILIQLPVVALFIWYFDRLYTRFETFLREERATRDKVLGEILGEVRDLREELHDHDVKVDMKITQAVTKTVERTKPRSNP